VYQIILLYPKNFVYLYVRLKTTKKENVMIRKKTNGPLVIDLTGPQGNAYFLLGTANNIAKQLGLNPNEITNEMKAGNYENLLQVFDRYFGDYVILEK